MERYSQVLEVQIEQDGSTHRASYFVEGNTIHASIVGKIVAVPVGPRSAADTVKSLLSGYLAQRSRRRALGARWMSA